MRKARKIEHMFVLAFLSWTIKMLCFENISKIGNNKEKSGAVKKVLKKEQVTGL